MNNFNHLHYVPCLRWKLGEYQAVFRSSEAVRKNLAPLIEVPEIGWDHENKKDVKTIDEHLSKFLKRVDVKWGKTACFIDLNLINSSARMKTGILPIKFVFDGLYKNGCQAIPVTGIGRDQIYHREAKKIIREKKTGLCLRVKLEEANKTSIKADIDSLLVSVKQPVGNCHLILDLGATNFEPLEGFMKCIQAIISRFPYLKTWKTFTLLGTAFPKSMGGIKPNGIIVPRYEWQLYKILVKHLRKTKLRLPTFGDYTIAHPDVLLLDMRLVKPSATVRYTVDNSWYIMKGKNVRDNGYEQYRQLCRQILESGYYCDSTFSWGDDYIRECAKENGSTGNLTTWRQVGTNHHLAKVVKDVANFYAS